MDSGATHSNRWGTLILALVLVLGTAGYALAESGPANPAAVLPGETVVRHLVEQNRIREQRLQQYTVLRHYTVQNEDGETRAEATVLLSFRAPSTKEFRTISETGSGAVANVVFKQLLESEAESTAGRNRVDRSITPENYRFTMLGRERVDGHDCFVLSATPKRRERYLFEGKVWVHATDYAVVRIVGRPARNPSWWVKSAQFERRYQKIGEFWLPLRDETLSQVRMFGRNTLTIEYSDYHVVPLQHAQEGVREAAPAGGLRGAASLLHQE
jgi:hypothetical protein